MLRGFTETPVYHGESDYNNPPKQDYVLDLLPTADFKALSCHPRRGSSTDLATAQKDFTPHQLAFAQSGRLPGSCTLVNNTDSSPPRVDDVYALFHHMAPYHQKARPLQKVYRVDPALETAEFVFLRNLARQYTLTPPDKGPYRVLSGAEMAYHIAG